MTPGFSHDFIPHGNTSPLSIAESIARSAAGQVNWKSEPLSDRERRIRARWIEEHMATDLGRFVLIWSAVCARHGANASVGSDLRAAADEARLFSGLERADQDNFARIAADLDDEDAAA